MKKFSAISGLLLSFVIGLCYSAETVYWVPSNIKQSFTFDKYVPIKLNMKQQTNCVILILYYFFIQYYAGVSKKWYYHYWKNQWCTRYKSQAQLYWKAILDSFRKFNYSITGFSCHFR